MKKIKETGDSRYIYQNNVEKKVFEEKSFDGTVKSEIMLNQELAEVQHKPIITKFGKRKVRSSFISNILRPNLARYVTNKYI